MRILVFLLAAAAAAPPIPSPSTNRPAHPTIMIMVEKSVKGSSTLTNALQTALQNTLGAEGAFTPIVYRPDLSVIRNALKSHVLSPEELKEPIGAEALMHIANTMQTSDLLWIKIHQQAQTIDADYEVMISTGSGFWITPLISHISEPRYSLKRKLSDAAIVASLTDSITSKLGDPSHLLSQIEVGSRTVVTGDASEVKKPQLASKASPSAMSAVPAHDYAASAKRYLQSNDLPNAVTMLRRAINDDPMNPALRGELAHTYLKMNLPILAGRVVAESSLLLPNNPDISRIQAEILLEEGKAADAIVLFQNMIKSAPKDVNLRISYADALLADSRYSEAETEYTKAMQIAPSNPQPSLKLASFYFQQADGDANDYPKSLESIQRARSLISPVENAVYSTEYKSLMQMAGERIRDMSDSLQALYSLSLGGDKSRPSLLKTLTDIQARAAALSDYLDNLTPAHDMSDAQAHFSQSAAMLLQGISILQRTLANPGNSPQAIRDRMLLNRINTLHTLTRAEQILIGEKSVSGDS